MFSFKRFLAATVLFLSALYFLLDLRTDFRHRPDPTDATEYEIQGAVEPPQFKYFPEEAASATQASRPATAPQDAKVSPVPQQEAKDTPKPQDVKPGSRPAKVSPAPQQQAKDTPNPHDPLSLEALLASQFPYDANAALPAHIWQTCKTPPSSSDAVTSWSLLNPGFTHHVLTDAAASALVHALYAAVPHVVEAYDALPLPILKADFFRYLVLLAQGGTYSDIDTTALKPLREWLPRAGQAEVENNSNSNSATVGLVVGVEADGGKVPNWRAYFTRRVQFCQWTIQAKVGHPVLRAVVANITREALRRKNTTWAAAVGKEGEGAWALEADEIMELTGPAVWTDVVYAYFNDARYFGHGGSGVTWANFTGLEEGRRVGDTLVLPIASFSRWAARGSTMRRCVRIVALYLFLAWLTLYLPTYHGSR
ncbi:nucleotide-diphospho-sugar transferase [Mycena rebaudengoi]|nr:nucleotide-diphospho-sugar transferase [Mycena rebaudengoi]